MLVRVTGRAAMVLAKMTETERLGGALSWLEPVLLAVMCSRPSTLPLPKGRLESFGHVRVLSQGWGQGEGRVEGLALSWLEPVLLAGTKWYK